MLKEREHPEILNKTRDFLRAVIYLVGVFLVLPMAAVLLEPTAFTPAAFTR